MGMAESTAIKTNESVIFFLILSGISAVLIFRLLRKDITIKYIPAIIGIVIIVVIKKFSSTRPAFNRPGNRPIIRIDENIIIPTRNRISCTEFLLFIFFLSEDKITSWRDYILFRL
jgi:hypothetical protein